MNRRVPQPGKPERIPPTRHLESFHKVIANEQVVTRFSLIQHHVVTVLGEYGVEPWRLALTELPGRYVTLHKWLKIGQIQLHNPNIADMDHARHLINSQLTLRQPVAFRTLEDVKGTGARVRRLRDRPNVALTSAVSIQLGDARLLAEQAAIREVIRAPEEHYAIPELTVACFPETPAASERIVEDLASVASLFSITLSAIEVGKPRTDN